MAVLVNLESGPVSVSNKLYRQLRKVRRVNEVEVKILPRSGIKSEPEFEEEEFERIRKVLEGLKAKRVFKGPMTTWWYWSPRTVSRRTRVAKNELRKNPQDEHSWTLKKNPPDNRSTPIAKVKDEYERVAGSRDQAKLHLEIVSHILGVDGPNLNEPELSAGKRRESFSVPLKRETSLKKIRALKEAGKRRFDKLEVALDVYQTSNGESIEPVYVIEIQDTSPRLSAEIKEQRIAAFAELLKLKIDPAVASLSTEGLYRHLGIVGLKNLRRVSNDVEGTVIDMSTRARFSGTMNE